MVDEPYYIDLRIRAFIEQFFACLANVGRNVYSFKIVIVQPQTLALLTTSLYLEHVLEPWGWSINHVTVLGGEGIGFCDESTRAIVIKRGH